jgi:hypothetical protein
MAFSYRAPEGGTTPPKKPTHIQSQDREREAEADLSQAISSALYGKKMRGMEHLKFASLEAKYQGDLAHGTTFGKEIRFAKAMLEMLEYHQKIDLAYAQTMEKTVEALAERGIGFSKIERVNLEQAREMPDLKERWERVNELQTAMVDQYSKLLEEGRHLFRIGSEKKIRLDTALMSIFREDLQYRLAEMVKNPEEREQVWASLDREHENAVRTIDLTAEIGHIREYALIQVLRKQFRALNKNHLFHVQHALPSDDFGNGIDLFFSAGGKRIGVSLKTGLYDDSEFHAEEIARARAHSEAELIWFFHPNLVKEAESGHPRAMERLLRRLFRDNALSKNDHGWGTLLAHGLLPEKPGAGGARRVIEVKEVEPYLNISILKKVGVLTGEINGDSVRVAKERLMECILSDEGQEIFKGVKKGKLKEHLEDPRTIDRLKKLV